MELDASSLAFLEQETRACSAHDLAQAYSFNHSLNASRQLRRLRVNDARTELLWHIEFRNGANEIILEYPLARCVRSRAFMFGDSGEALVVQNLHFVLKQAFKGQKFARALYDAEHALYANWGVREIQMTAIDDGLHVWVKDFGFTPAPEIAAVLADEFRDWASRRGEPNLAPPADPSQYPREFLATRASLQLYKRIGD